MIAIPQKKTFPLGQVVITPAAESLLQNTGKTYHLNFASRQFGAGARRAGRRCISILQVPRNKADAPKLCDRLFRRTSVFLQIGFITHWVSACGSA